MIVFIGAPGAGKSTVGKLVAQQLGLEFCDSDELIESQVGKSISDIFVTEGEQVFRQIEEELIVSYLDSADGVFSLGGGALGSAEVRDALKGHDVVWLQAGLSQTVERIGMNRNRPLLLGNVRGQLAELMSAREPLYKESATFTVDTSHLTSDEVAKVVCVELEKAGS